MARANHRIKPVKPPKRISVKMPRHRNDAKEGLYRQRSNTRKRIRSDPANQSLSPKEIQTLIDAALIELNKTYVYSGQNISDHRYPKGRPMKVKTNTKQASKTSAKQASKAAGNKSHTKK